MPRFIMRCVWVVRIVSRLAAGRWFIFRDAPNWVVEEMITLKSECYLPGAPVGMAELVECAEDEARRRASVPLPKET